MRSLALTHVLPWPANNGVRIGVANVVRALTQAGEVELFNIHSTKEIREIDVAAGLAGESVFRTWVAVRPPTFYTIGQRFLWMAGSSLPNQIGARDYSAVRWAFLAWTRALYDLIRMARAETFVALHGLVVLR